MSKQYLIARIRAECQVVLVNIDHPSRKSNFEDALRRLQKVIEEYFAENASLDKVENNQDGVQYP